MTTRLSTKGRLIFPEDIRERHGWRAGTRLEDMEAAIAKGARESH